MFMDQKQCWLKLTNTWKYYKADAIILGGDLTGKELVPILEQKDGTFSAEVDGIVRTAKQGEELEKLEKIIRNHGLYPYRTNEQEYLQLRDDLSKRSDVFGKSIVDRLAQWVTIADERLKSSDVKIYVTGGNDDEKGVIEFLQHMKSEKVVNADQKVVEVGEYEMCGLGYSNMTPWKCPRNVTEDELEKKISQLTDQVKNMERAIFNFHCPPFKTDLDNAPLLDETLRPKIGRGGGPILVPVGSTAV